MPDFAKKWWVLVGTGIAVIIITIDFTIVNTALANIQQNLHMNVTQLQWIEAGFGLLFSTLLVTMGRFADIVGRRKMIYAGMIGFGLASLGAGFSNSGYFLIAMRILQGLFGAIILPCGMAIVADAFPLQQRGRALGVFGSLIGTGFAIGPMLGSLIITLFSWRWIFFINLPVIALSFLICIPSVRESRLSVRPSVDWLGAITLVIFLVGLIFTISEGATFGWTSTIIIVTLIAAIFGLIGFLLAEKNAKDPLMPFALFANRGFVLAVLIYVAAISFTWPVIFFMPLYLHNVIGFHTGKVGLILACMTIMTMISPIIAGHWYDKKSKSFTIHLTFALSAISLFLFTLLNTTGPLWLIIVSFVIFGFAWGMGNGIAIPLSLSELPNTENAGLVGGAASTILNIVGVLALTTTTTLFRYKEGSTLFALMSQHNIQLNNQQMNLIKSLLSAPEKIKHILSAFSQATADKIVSLAHMSFVAGMRFAFLMLLVCVIVLWMFAGFYRPARSNSNG